MRDTFVESKLEFLSTFSEEQCIVHLCEVDTSLLSEFAPKAIALGFKFTYFSSESHQRMKGHMIMVRGVESKNIFHKAKQNKLKLFKNLNPDFNKIHTSIEGARKTSEDYLKLMFSLIKDDITLNETKVIETESHLGKMVFLHLPVTAKKNSELKEYFYLCLACALPANAFVIGDLNLDKEDPNFKKLINGDWSKNILECYECFHDATPNPRKFTDYHKDGYATNSDKQGFVGKIDHILGTHLKPEFEGLKVSTNPKNIETKDCPNWMFSSDHSAIKISFEHFFCN